MSRPWKIALGVVLAGVVVNLALLDRQIRPTSPADPVSDEPGTAGNQPPPSKALELSALLGRVTVDYWNRKADFSVSPYETPSDEERALKLPTLYVEGHAMGEPPMRAPIHLQEGHYRVLVLTTLTGPIQHYPAPFYALSSPIDVQAGSDQTVTLKETAVQHLTPRYMTAKARAAWTYVVQGIPQDKKLAAFREYYERSSKIRSTVAAHVEDARYDPLLQQVGTLYDAALRSPPARDRFLVRGVPIIGRDAIPESLDLELSGPQIVFLSSWLIEKHFLGEDPGDLEEEIGLMGLWQDAMQALGNQEALNDAFALKGKLTALRAEVDQYRTLIERTSSNLRDLLVSAETHR